LGLRKTPPFERPHASRLNGIEAAQVPLRYPHDLPRRAFTLGSKWFEIGLLFPWRRA